MHLGRRARISIVYVAAVCLAACPYPGRTVSADVAPDGRAPESLNASASSVRYESYAAGRPQAPAGERIDIDATRFSSSTGMQAEDLVLDGVKALATEESGTVSWDFIVRESGLYDVLVTYYALPGNDGPIERRILLDGAVPYQEAMAVRFSRIWKNHGDSKVFTTAGNEYRRNQEEVPRWQQTLLHSALGYSDASMRLYLSEGDHTLTMESIAEPMAISRITLFASPAPESYASVSSRYPAEGCRPSSASVLIEGEDAIYRSDPTLYAVEDRTSPANRPFDEARILLNCIGGSSWRHRQQWIEWSVSVPEDGLYAFSLRAKQDFVSGAQARRCLTIDGRIPFAEAADIPIPYDLRWQTLTLADPKTGNPYEFHLTKGQHVIRLEAVTGDMAPILDETRDIVQILNSLYRRIKKIVGSFPDPFRDYKLEKSVPDLFSTLQECIGRLEAIDRTMVEKAYMKGEQSRSIDQLVVQLKSFIRFPDTIPERQNDLSDAINGVSSWLASASEVPLLVDCLVLAPAGSELPPADAGFFRKLWSTMKSFGLSFVKASSEVEGLAGQKEPEKEVSLWLGTGRDQAMIIKNLADSRFTSDSGIALGIRLVDMSILLQAVASGAGPDVALFMDQAQPLNFGMRGALCDLGRFSDLDRVLQRFPESAVAPYRFQDAVYGLPEQQTFPMMFYRTDIFAEMELTPPETWDDLLRLIPSLQEQNMEIGLPSPAMSVSGSQATSLNPVFAALLLQSGAAIYDRDERMCMLDTPTAVRSFIRWSEFYTKYGFPVYYSDINRFRTGEMPLLLNPYSFYNTLVLAAPEIHSLWEMTPIVGIRRDDGSIDRSASGSGTACVIFRNADDPDAAWRFLKWWTSTDTQVEYGRDIEALQGSSARWPSANLQAMQRMGWTSAQSARIEEQWRSVVGIPEVPGGYYVGRSVDNAIKSVINSGEDARETILDQVDRINKEIMSKRREFGLE